MKRKILKLLKIMLVLGGLFLLVTIPLYLFSNSGANKRLKDVRQAILDQGLPTDLRELVERESDLPPMVTVLERMTSLTLALPSGLVNPNDPPDKRGIPIDVMILAGDTINSPSSMTAQQQADLIYIFDNNPELLGLWKKLAGADSDFFYGVDLSTPPCEWRTTVDLLGIQSKLRLPLAISVALAKAGREAEAVDVWRLPVDSTRGMLNNSNALIGNIVAIGNFSGAMKACRTLVADGEMDAAMLRELSDGLEGTAIAEGMRKSMMTDRLILLNYLDDTLKKETNPFASYDCPTLFGIQAIFQYGQGVEFHSQGPLAGRFALRAVCMLGKPFMTQELAEMHERTMQWQEVMKLEPWEWKPSAEERGLQAPNEKVPPWKVLTFLSGIRAHEPSTMERVLATEVKLQATRLGLACEMWRQENGDLPPSLEILAPKYIDAVVPDPFTGQPFEYTQSGTAFSILSKMEETPDKGEPYRLGWGL